MRNSKVRMTFIVGEGIILALSFYGAVKFVFPFTLEVFHFTMTNAFDFYTPTLFALPVAYFLVAMPLSTIWYIGVKKAVRKNNIF